MHPVNGHHVFPKIVRTPESQGTVARYLGRETSAPNGNHHDFPDRIEADRNLAP